MSSKVSVDVDALILAFDQGNDDDELMLSEVYGIMLRCSRMNESPSTPNDVATAWLDVKEQSSDSHFRALVDACIARLFLVAAKRAERRGEAVPREVIEKLEDTMRRRWNAACDDYGQDDGDQDPTSVIAVPHN